MLGVTMDDQLQAVLDAPSGLIPRTDGRIAAVSAIIDDDHHLLFVVRATRPGDPWSGQVAFPGGHVEPQDADLIDTAIRETFEEVGLPMQRHQCLGQLSDKNTRGMRLPKRLIRPFVFRVPEFTTLALQASEVAEIRRVPLSYLLTGTDRSTFEFSRETMEYTLPCVELAGARLWGLTLSMVDDLLDRIDGKGTGLDRPRHP